MSEPLPGQLGSITGNSLRPNVERLKAKESAAKKASQRARLIPGTGNPIIIQNPTEPYGPAFPDSKIGFKSQRKVGKEFGGILRYPYEALTDKTDYLQIDIRQYDSVAAVTKSESNPRGSLISSSGSQRSINNIIDVKGTTKSDLRKTKFISGKGTILLPMPSNIQDGNSVSYSEGNLDGVTARVFGAIDSVFKDATVDKGSIQGLTKALTTAAGKIGDATIFNANFKGAVMAGLAAEAANIPLGGSLTRDAVFARVQGEIINQNVELLFNGVNLRSFKFSFKLTPRGPDEAKQILLIINAFKKNMAPKLGGGDNFFLKTPNVFELVYKKGSGLHPFLHTFKQCVLTDMSVNYTGEGTYATYAGDEGAPVSTVLELGFKELEPIYDLDYDDNLPGVGY
jgi:hypothetical protein